MTKITNYSDFNGQTVELNCVFGMDNAKFATAFPGITGRRYDSFSRMVGCAVGSRVELPVTRSVEYKAFASKHVCDARCLNASGRIMKCECACGGKNHGAGFIAVAA
jgi:hypothetical protein